MNAETLLNIVAIIVASAAVYFILQKSIVDAVFFVVMALYIFTWGFIFTIIHQTKKQ